MRTVDTTNRKTRPDMDPILLMLCLFASGITVFTVIVLPFIITDLW
jgi:hypothetical protein